MLVKVSAMTKMFKQPNLPQSSIKKIPIFDKLLAMFNFGDINGLKEISERIFSFNGYSFTALATRSQSIMGSRVF